MSRLHTLGYDKWKEFKVGDILTEIYKAKANIKNDMNYTDVPSDETIRFISRTEQNNGCDCYILRDEAKNIEKGNAITIGDTTSTATYQDDNFVCGDHMVVCRADWMNKYRAIFLLTILKMERYKYSYGRSFKMTLIKDTKIKLPANKEGNPDWLYMENYIKNLPYGDRI